jgi:RimJ/RimL family protein N-acetyltransferase
VSGEVLLTTRRLVLRGFTAADADLLVALDADPEVMRYITGGIPTPRDEIVDAVLPAWLAIAAATGGRYGFWAALDRATGAFLGWFHLRPEPAEEVDPELGYRLRRSAWGAGLASEGATTLLDHAFADPRVRRVLAQTMVVNRRSRRVMERIGMRQVRVFHGQWPVPIPGDEHGDVEYAITREEWSALRAGAPGGSAGPHPPTGFGSAPP